MDVGTETPAARWVATVERVMSTDLVTVAPTASFHEVVETLLEHDISGVPVIDEDRRLLGMISEADLITNEAYQPPRRRHLSLLQDHLRGKQTDWVGKAGGRSAGEVMSAPVDVVGADTEITRAARLMLEHRHKRLAVCDDGMLVGIVTRHDLLKPFGRPDDELAEAVEGLLRNPLRVPNGHEVLARIDDGVVRLAGSTEYPRDIAVICSVIAREPGVVAVEADLHARSAEPNMSEGRRNEPPWT